MVAIWGVGRCQLTAWSSGMILGLGLRGAGFNSWSGPSEVLSGGALRLRGPAVFVGCGCCHWVCTFRCNLVVSIFACHAGNPGFIPDCGILPALLAGRLVLFVQAMVVLAGAFMTL